MERRLAKSFRVFAGALFLLSCFAEGAQAQASFSKQATISETAGKLRLSGNDSRPLTQALTALQQKFGWRLNYEDPQYISKLDVVAAKDLLDKSSYPDGEHRIPRGGVFAVEFPAGSPPDAAPDEQKTLQLIVDAYNRSGNPGQFELRRDKDRTEQVFDVVGTAAHDNQGRVSGQQAVLDLPITLAVEERTASDTIDLICQKIAEKAHVKITLGVHPLGLDRIKVTVGGKELAARSYLFRALESPGPPLSWRLLYDPDSNSYFMNLHHIKLTPAKATSAPKSAP
jgi:hypothetical protein